MGFFKSLKGICSPGTARISSRAAADKDCRNRQERRSASLEQPYPPPLSQFSSQNTPYVSTPSAPPRPHEYAASPDPPPGHQRYEQPDMPSASFHEPPPYHDWTVIPDTAILPPPPSITYEAGIAGNAETREADRARDWCRNYPLVSPHQPSLAQITAVKEGDVRLMKPREYKGELLMPSTGVWRGSTRAGSPDSCLLTSSPLYFAYSDSPARTGHAKTIYFELEIVSLGYGSKTDESTIAVGFCAMPYPTWRMPGWERASLAVHSDVRFSYQMNLVIALWVSSLFYGVQKLTLVGHFQDGHRFVNDNRGGKRLTNPFTAGDTVGIGMSFSFPESPPDYNILPQYTSSTSQVEVFFTRNGKKEGDWNLHEELDRDTELGVDGLDGLFDLYGAIGIFGGTQFRVKFRRDEWLWRPR